MKISMQVILVVLALFSIPLAQSSDARNPKRKLPKEPVREERHHKFPGLFPGPFGKGHPGIRTKPRTPYVDEETSANSGTVNEECHGHRYKDVQKGRHVGVYQQDHHIGVDQQGRHVGHDQQSHHVGVDQRGRPVRVDQQVHHIGDQQGRHVGHDQQSHHFGVDQRGRPVRVDQQVHHVGDQQGRHVEHKQQNNHVGVDQRGRHEGVDEQSHQVGVGQQVRPIGVVQDGRQADAKQRGRQTRQSHNTFLTGHVPTVGGLLGGAQGSSGFQQLTFPQFPVGSHVGNRPGNQGGFTIPIVLGPGGSGGHVGSGGFRPDPLGPFGVNGNFPFIPYNPTGGSPGTSSAGGPGGLSSGPDSGLAGGLGGVYGAGYGFGLGGLIFGGPNGPVFAGNAALGEGLMGSPEDGVANDEFEDPDKQNPVQTPRIPPFRPVPSRGNSFEANKAKADNQANRGVTGTYPKAQYINANGRTLSPTSNGGETIGYVAFIFPKRNFQRQNPKASESSSHSGADKSPTHAPTSKPKAEIAPVTTRPAPTFLPVPVHIPIDRPYPVLVPKPYPVAVPIIQPVPYEVARSIPLPFAVPADVTRPAQSPFLTGVNGVGSVVLQPSLETRILHKRSDKIPAAKPA